MRLKGRMMARMVRKPQDLESPWVTHLDKWMKQNYAKYRGAEHGSSMSHLDNLNTSQAPTAWCNPPSSLFSSFSKHAPREQACGRTVMARSPTTTSASLFTSGPAHRWILSGWTTALGMSSTNLVGGFFPPIWEICKSQIGSFPQGSGWK